MNFLRRLIIYIMVASVLQACGARQGTPGGVSARELVDAHTQANARAAFSKVSKIFVVKNKAGQRLGLADDTLIISTTASILGVAVFAGGAAAAARHYGGAGGADGLPRTEGPDALTRTNGRQNGGLDEPLSTGRRGGDVEGVGLPRNLPDSPITVAGRQTVAAGGASAAEISNRLSDSEHTIMRDDGTVIVAKEVEDVNDIDVGDATVVGLVGRSRDIQEGIIADASGNSVLIRSEAETNNGVTLATVQRNPSGFTLEASVTVKAELDAANFKPTPAANVDTPALRKKIEHVTRLGSEDGGKIAVGAEFKIGDTEFKVGEKLLGKGAFGEVFDVQIKDADGVSSVAVKKIAADKIHGDTATELQMLNLLNGRAGFVEYYGSFKDSSGNLYITMQKMDGTLPMEFKPQTMSQMVTRLEQLKEAGIVHNDIKPENFMVSKDDIYLGDFGAATDAITALVGRGKTAFSPKYVAPERMNTKIRKFEPYAGDLYSTGVTLLECKHPGLFARVEGQMYAKAKSIARQELGPDATRTALNEATVSHLRDSYYDGTFAKNIQTELSRTNMDPYDMLLSRMIEPNPAARIDLPTLRAEMTSRAL